MAKKKAGAKKVLGFGFLVQFIAAFGLLLMGLSVAYYFLIFLPERAEMEYQSQMMNRYVVENYEEPEEEVSDEQARSEFVDMVLMEWEIYNKLQEFFVEPDYIVAMTGEKDEDRLYNGWRVLDIHKAEILNLLGAQLKVLRENCFNNSFCKKSEYGLMSLETLSSLVGAQVSFYLSEGEVQVVSVVDDVEVSKNYFADLASSYDERVPDFLHFMIVDNLDLQGKVNSEQISKMVEYGMYEEKKILKYEEIIEACGAVDPKYHAYARYLSNCVSDIDYYRGQVEKLESSTDFEEFMGHRLVCHAERKLQEKTECTRSNAYFRYIQSFLIN